MTKIRDKKTGRFIGEGLTKKCLVCGKVFPTARSIYGRSKYCSKKCSSLAKVGTKQSQESIDKRAKSNRGQKRTDSFKKAQSNRQMGEGNSNYNGGWTKDKAEKKKYWERRRYGKTKAEWLEHFGGKCTSCGMTNEESLLKDKLRLAVHHKDGKGRNSKTPNNSAKNIELLCAECHGKVHLNSDRAKKMQIISLKRKEYN